MTEYEIRAAADMYALVAEMEVVKARVEGMRADNSERIANGHALAYTSHDFWAAERELCEIAKRLRDEI